MKKYLVCLLIILLITGCKRDDKEDISDEKISSSGELVCAYKLQNTTDNTMYTSYYIFNFDNNGILNGAKNTEIIEFYNSSNEVKQSYKDSLEEAILDYNDIKGITVTKSIEDDKYSFEVDMNNSEMEESIKSDYLLDLDRISLYKLFTSDRYICE